MRILFKITLIFFSATISCSSYVNTISGDYYMTKHEGLRKEKLSIHANKTFSYLIFGEIFGTEYVGGWHLRGGKVFLDGIFHDFLHETFDWKILGAHTSDSDLIPKGKRALKIFIIENDTSLFTGCFVKANSGKYVMGFDPILLDEKDKSLEISLLSDSCNFNLDSLIANQLDVFIRQTSIKRFDSTRKISLKFDYRIDGLYNNGELVFKRE